MASWIETIVECSFILLFLAVILYIPFMITSNPKTYEDAYKQTYLDCLKVNQATKEIPNLENYCNFYAASRMK